MDTCSIATELHSTHSALHKSALLSVATALHKSALHSVATALHKSALHSTVSVLDSTISDSAQYTAASVLAVTRKLHSLHYCTSLFYTVQSKKYKFGNKKRETFI